MEISVITSTKATTSLPWPNTSRQILNVVFVSFRAVLSMSQNAKLLERIRWFPRVLNLLLSLFQERFVTLLCRVFKLSLLAYTG